MRADVSNAPGAVPPKNPEAGMHRMTSDPRELDAALAAGAQSLQRFPYYTLRYGERGARFTGSDSAWLVALANERRDGYIDEQMRWFGRILAIRGMPRWLLEVHLRTLAHELARAVPERSAKYARLAQAAERLAEERRAVMGDRTLDRIGKQFDAETDRAWAARLPCTGHLLAAAVADERCGIPEAVTAASSWLADPARFPKRWITAVEQAIARARRVTPRRSAARSRPTRPTHPTRDRASSR